MRKQSVTKIGGAPVADTTTSFIRNEIQNLRGDVKALFDATANINTSVAVLTTMVHDLARKERPCIELVHHVEEEKERMKQTISLKEGLYLRIVGGTVVALFSAALGVMVTLLLKGGWAQ